MGPTRSTVERTFGPLKVELTPNGDGTVAYKVKLAGVIIGDGVLKPGESARIGGGALGFKAETDLALSDGLPREVTFSGEACFLKKCKTYAAEIPLDGPPPQP